VKPVPYALLPTRGERFARGAVVGYVVVLVRLPLLALLALGLSDGFSHVVSALSSPVARHALLLTIWTSALVAVVNLVFGTATAWVLVRYPVVGKSALSALVDLPLSVPTLVAGIMLSVLYGPLSLVGTSFEAFGVKIIFAPLGIVLALAFVTLPFVVRAVEPVLHEIDAAEEEAAKMLGASPLLTFRTVFLPAIAPAALSASIRSLGRALGEFGSIVVVSGNIPMRTLTAPVYILGEIESGVPESAAAVSVLLLALALSLHAGASFAEKRLGARHA
jgi:sulfate transport system permease protein